jgi:exosome complex component RRP43
MSNRKYTVSYNITSYPSVCCGIKVKIAPPHPSTPRSGFMVPNIDIPPMAHPSLRLGPPAVETQVLSQMLDRILRAPDTFDLTQLVISEGALVWVVYVDVVVLNYDGSVLDAVLLAVNAALGTAMLPKVACNEETAVVAVVEDSCIPFQIGSKPLGVCIAVLESKDGDKIILVDPDCDEQNIACALVQLVFEEEGGLVGMTQSRGGKDGGTGISIEADVLKQVIVRGKERHAEVRGILNKALLGGSGMDESK